MSFQCSENYCFSFAHFCISGFLTGEILLDDVGIRGAVYVTVFVCNWLINLLTNHKRVTNAEVIKPAYYDARVNYSDINRNIETFIALK